MKVDIIVTILILVDGFLQCLINELLEYTNNVTILILVDGFLNNRHIETTIKCICHNPYFSRWFSAMLSEMIEEGNFELVTILILVDGFLQYRDNLFIKLFGDSHNPYFSRWFSAM